MLAHVLGGGGDGNVGDKNLAENGEEEEEEAMVDRVAVVVTKE